MSEYFRPRLANKFISYVKSSQFLVAVSGHILRRTLSLHVDTVITFGCLPRGQEKMIYFMNEFSKL